MNFIQRDIYNLSCHQREDNVLRDLEIVEGKNSAATEVRTQKI